MKKIDSELSDKLLQHAKDLDDFLHAVSSEGWKGCSGCEMRVWTDQFYEIVKKHLDKQLKNVK